MPTSTLDPPIVRFHNCRVAQFSAPKSGEFVTHQSDELWIRAGHIIDPQDVFYHEERRPDININCGGAILAPGLVDLQVNGGWGVDFTEMDNPEEGIQLVAKNLLKHGVTSFSPTLVSSSPATYRQILPRLVKTKGSLETGAAVIGAHLEGPFISSKRSGCHDPRNLRIPTEGVASLLDMYSKDSLLKNVAIVTLAPELPGALPVIEWLSSQGILVSLGHSCASISDGEKAVRSGARFVTHLFNAMLPFHHREPGLVGLLAMETKMHQMYEDSEDGIHFGIIADGIHAHPAALRVVHRMAPRSLCLVSDQVIAAGLPDGKHHFPGLGRHIEVCGRRATLMDSPETLAGAVTLLDECVRTFKKETACSIDYALAAASKHPAVAMQLFSSRQCGSLDVGAVADIILVDPNSYAVQSTYLAGKCVYSAH